MIQSKSLQVLKFFNFSEVEFLPTVGVITSAFRSKVYFRNVTHHFWILKLTNFRFLSKTCFEQGYAVGAAFDITWLAITIHWKTIEKQFYQKWLTLQSIFSSTKPTCTWWRRFQKNWQILFMPMSKTCFKVEKYRWVASLSLVSFCHLPALTSADKYPISNINHFIRHYAASYTTPLFFFSVTRRTKIFFCWRYYSNVHNVTSLTVPWCMFLTSF